jgi:hypothetical protein
MVEPSARFYGNRFAGIGRDSKGAFSLDPGSGDRIIGRRSRRRYPAGVCPAIAPNVRKCSRD